MDIVLILQTNYIGKEWSISDNSYSTLEWFSDSEKPTEEELETAWPDVQYKTTYAAVAATRQREYQAISDGIFFQWQRKEKTEQEWLDSVRAINDANPYPTAEEVQAAAIVPEEPAVEEIVPVVEELPIETPVEEPVAAAEETPAATE